MQQEANNAKQLIAERIRQSTNILVAVSTNPSVDALSAALAFSLILNKLDKHATAVFSGQIPPAIEFLEPGKTFENTVDGLRDFIISLDKEKADRLRYKVEDDVVKIFITPYRAVITEKDLQFSQGELNVELVIALGVEKQDELDKAIMAHGRILHDATVVAINANNQRSSLGSIDFHDPNASSLCEMLMNLTESFQQPGLVDAQISTALLTGVVAATERFSNDRTSPRVMTIAAQLMAAGANQQLIATSLGQPQPLPTVSQPIQPGSQSTQTPTIVPKKDGELDIAHDKSKKEKLPKNPQTGNGTSQQSPGEEALGAALPVTPVANAFDELKNAIVSDTPPAPKQQAPPPATSQKNKQQQKIRPAKSAPQPQEPVAMAQPEPEPAVSELAQTPAETPDYLSSHSSWKGKRLEPPTMGGSLSATAQQALDDKQRADKEQRNQTLLSHPDEPAAVADQAPSAEPAKQPPTPQEAPLPPPPAAEESPLPPPPPPPAVPPAEPAPAPPPIQPEAPVLASLPPAPEPAPLPPPPALPPQPPATEPSPQPPNEASSVPAPPTPPVDIDAARKAVSDALGVPEGPEQPPLPVEQPPVQMPDASGPALPPPPAPLADGAMPSLPPLPPLPAQDGAMPPTPDLPTPPPLPPLDTTPIQPQPMAQPPEKAGPPVDPGQFKIPM